MTVDAGFAAWLKSESLFVSAAPANAAAWAGRGEESEVRSLLVNKADALAEAARQAGFLGGPNARDRHVVPGARKDLLGKTITIRGDRLGYTAAGVPAFVLGVVENDNGTSTITVLRKL